MNQESTYRQDTAIELLLCDTFQLSDQVRAKIIDIFAKTKGRLSGNLSEAEVAHFFSGKPDYELLLQFIGKEKAQEIAFNQVFLNGKRQNEKNNIQNTEGRIRYFMNLHNTLDADNE